MGINITDNGAPEPDISANPDPNNPDTYEDTDVNAEGMVQV